MIILLFIDGMLLLVMYANIYIRRMQEVKLNADKYVSIDMGYRDMPF